MSESPTLASKEGQAVPHVSFRVRRDGDWATLDSNELFNGKNVVLFSLPGAFTPTCSSTHLPRYNELAPVFRQHGIDHIVCLSVNDPFVMEEWAKSQHCDELMLLPDGNAAFTDGMGMLVDKSDLNFGRRSWRYAMLVRDGRIEKMFIEPQEPGDPFKVSDADTMLNYLAPDALKPDAIAMLSRDGCPFCAKAKKMLSDAGLVFVDVPLDGAIRNKALSAIAGEATVPQVFVNGSRVGGSEDLARWLQARQAS